MEKKDIVCIIITYNIGNKIFKCYNSIKSQVDKIIIIDNGSSKDTIDSLVEIEKDYFTQVIYNNKNLGIAEALNIGVRVAQSYGYKWILTMDNDSEATEGMIDSMICTYNSISIKEKKDIVSIGANFIETAYENTQYITKSTSGVSKFTYEDILITSGNLVRLDIFNRIGYFKSDYFIDSVDYEFCLRIIKNSYKIIKIDNALLKHKIGDGIEKKIFFKTIHSSNHSAIRRYYITRNALDLYENYKDLDVDYVKEIKLMLLKMFIKIILVEKDKFNKLKYGIKGYMDYKKGIYGKINI